MRKIAQDILKKRDAMAAFRSTQMNHWDELAPLFTQFRTIYNYNNQDIYPGDLQFESAPKQAVITFANGIASLIFPREDEFAEFSPPTALKDDDDAVRWTRQCSEIHQTYLQNSNFWEEKQEGFHDLGIYGTEALFCGGYNDEKDELYFRHIPIGTYYIAENVYGYVDTLYRELDYTADQAAEEYGKENLPKEIAEKVGKAAGAVDKFRFIHAVEPRNEYSKKGGKKNEKPYISVVVYEKTKDVVHEDGFDSFPYAVIRFRKQRNSPWGWGPASTVLGDARQLNKLNELADIGTEISVFPPAVVPGYMEGTVDFSALGLNYRDVNDTTNTPIQQLPIQNRLDQCNVRMQQKEDKINRAFFVDMFTLFARQAEMPGDITAYQASQMLIEKSAQFSPVYGRIISEGGDIIMRRDFETLLASGKFPPPPESMMDLDEKGNVLGLAEPSILYKNRIVLALQQRRNGAVPEVFSLIAPILQTNPEMAPIIFAGLELARIIRDAARNAGFPEEWLPDDATLKQRMQAIAEAEMQQRQSAMLNQGSDTLAKLGKAPPEAVQGALSALG